MIKPHDSFMRCIIFTLAHRTEQVKSLANHHSNFRKLETMSITSAAKGIMRKIVSIDIGASVSEASKIMTREELGSIVISKNGKPIGIMTERDVLRKVVEPGLNPREVSVGDVMSSPLITVSSETGIAEALRIMSDRNIRRLLVTEDDKIVGIITEMDLIKAIRDSYANLLTAIMEALKPLGKR